MKLVNAISKLVVWLSSFLEIVIFQRFIPNFTPAAIWLWGVSLFTGTVAGIWICVVLLAGQHQQWVSNFMISVVGMAISLGFMVFLPRILSLPTLTLKLCYSLFVLLVTSAIVIATVYLIVTIFVITLIIVGTILFICVMISATRKRVYVEYY
jgi:hypothetical protein